MKYFLKPSLKRQTIIKHFKCATQLKSTNLTFQPFAIASCYVSDTTVHKLFSFINQLPRNTINSSLYPSYDL